MKDWNDVQVENHYLNRWKDINGWDYFNPDDDEQNEQDDYDDYLFNRGMDDRRDLWERE